MNWDRAMRKEEQRAPLLGQDELETIARGCVHFQGSEDAMNAAYKIRDWYEAKITSGELMVVKTTTLKWIHPDPKHRDEVEVYGTGDTCVSCQTRFFLYADVHTRPNFCPGCGAKIVA